MRVVSLTNLIPPYRKEFYNELAKHHDTTVVLDGTASPFVSWREDFAGCDFAVEIVRGFRFQYQLKRKDLDFQDVRENFIPVGILKNLHRLAPDVIVTGEMGFRTLMAVIYGLLYKVPVILWWEGTVMTEVGRGWFRRLLRSFLVKQATRAWTNGRLSSEYLVGMGIDPAVCDEGMTGVNTNYFFDEVVTLRSDREAERARLGLSGKVFLFCGRVNRAKGVHLLLDALTAAKARFSEKVSLLVVGKGDCLENVTEWARANPEIPVHLAGFVQIEKLPYYYSLADVFVLPTLIDNWPLVSLEAIASGLPQVFSRYNGGAADLCPAGETGLVCDPMDPGDFADALVTASNWEKGKLSPGEISRIRHYYSPGDQARRAVQSIAKAVATES